MTVRSMTMLVNEIPRGSGLLELTPAGLAA